jgi:hypothetical protein
MSFHVDARPWRDRQTVSWPVQFLETRQWWGASFSRGRWAEAYWGTVGASVSGWDIRAERSMAMAAYAMTHVTTQRISAR